MVLKFGIGATFPLSPEKVLIHLIEPTLFICLSMNHWDKGKEYTVCQFEVGVKVILPPHLKPKTM